MPWRSADSRPGAGKIQNKPRTFSNIRTKESAQKTLGAYKKDGNPAGRGQVKDNLTIKTNNDGPWKRRRTLVEKLVKFK